jgi:hypothetical protein
MRGHEQYVERKIRLWVVQQERNRLPEMQPNRIDAAGAERSEPIPDANTSARQRRRRG